MSKRAHAVYMVDLAQIWPSIEMNSGTSLKAIFLLRTFTFICIRLYQQSSVWNDSTE